MYFYYTDNFMLYLSLRQYEYVLAVAKAGSMSTAAQTLNVSQPALSVAVQSVEKHLGKPLFIRRKGAHLKTTGFAVPFLEKVETLLQAAAELEDPKAVLTTARGRMRLGCFSDLAPVWLGPTLKMLRKALPEFDIVPMVADFETLAAEIASGSLDIAITYDLGLDATYERRPLARVQPFAFMGKDDDLAQRNSVALADLKNKPLILFEEGLSIRHMLALFAEQGMRPKVAHRVASLEVMRSFAGNGEGVGISYSAASGGKSYDGAEVVRLQISDSSTVEDIVAVYRADMLEVAPIETVITLLEQGH